MKTCANCGTLVSDEAAFCDNCGSSLLNNDSAAGATQNGAAKAETPSPAPAPAPTPIPTPVPVPNMANPQQQQAPFGQNQNQGQFQNQNPYQQQYMHYDPSDHTSEFDPRDIADNKLFAVIPYFLGIIVGIIVGIYVKESPYVKFHVKNAIRIQVAALLSLLLGIIPIIGWVAAVIACLILSVIKIIAIVWAFQGKAKDLPVISSIGFLK